MHSHTFSSITIWVDVQVDDVPCVSSSADENVMDLQQPNAIGDTERDGCGEEIRVDVAAKLELNSRMQSEIGSCYSKSGLNGEKPRGRNIGGNVDNLKDEGYHSDVDRRDLTDKNRSRKAISGDRISGNEEDKSSVDSEEGNEKGSKAGSAVNGAGVKEEVRLRRHGSDTDKNPKPSKRRRSAQGFSEISYKYHCESFCGFNERLPDGFYDAGRDRPFSSLEALEKEQPSLTSREVILVDR